jgi:hypothetical protein
MQSEASVRRRAKRLGYYVTKSRQRKCVPNINNHGRYMVTSFDSVILSGERFDASLEDIDDFLIAKERGLAGHERSGADQTVPLLL